MFLLTICFLLEILNLSSASQIGCVIESTACQAHRDNNLGLYPDIQTIEECRQLCNDNRDCQFLTYYGEDSFPLLQVCELFNDCSEKKSCQNCVTESRGCYTCSDQYTGVLSGDNLLGIYPDIYTELLCRAMCREIEGCYFYTFFTETLECYPLSHLIEPTRECEDCVTGPSYCSDDGPDLNCSLVFNGESSTALKLTDTSDAFNVSLVSNGNTCLSHFFLVGGGGSAPVFGGAGSGYLNYITRGYSEDIIAKIQVGGDGQTTRVIIEGKVIINATNGGDSYRDSYNQEFGGDGFSGGGSGSANGGSNGTDGYGHYGGQGSGEGSLITHSMKQFVLEGEGGFKRSFSWWRRRRCPC